MIVPLVVVMAAAVAGRRLALSAAWCHRVVQHLLCLGLRGVGGQHSLFCLFLQEHQCEHLWLVRLRLDNFRYVV